MCVVGTSGARGGRGGGRHSAETASCHQAQTPFPRPCTGGGDPELTHSPKGIQPGPRALEGSWNKASPSWTHDLSLKDTTEMARVRQVKSLLKHTNVRRKAVEPGGRPLRDKATVHGRAGPPTMPCVAVPGPLQAEHHSRGCAPCETVLTRCWCSMRPTGVRCRTSGCVPCGSTGLRAVDGPGVPRTLTFCLSYLRLYKEELTGNTFTSSNSNGISKIS